MKTLKCTPGAETTLWRPEGSRATLMTTAARYALNQGYRYYEWDGWIYETLTRRQTMYRADDVLIRDGVAV